MIVVVVGDEGGLGVPMLPHHRTCHFVVIRKLPYMIRVRGINGSRRMSWVRGKGPSPTCERRGGPGSLCCRVNAASMHTLGICMVESGQR